MQYSGPLCQDTGIASFLRAGCGQVRDREDGVLDLGADYAAKYGPEYLANVPVYDASGRLISEILRRSRCYTLPPPHPAVPSLARCLLVGTLRIPASDCCRLLCLPDGVSRARVPRLCRARGAADRHKARHLPHRWSACRRDGVPLPDRLPLLADCRAPRLRPITCCGGILVGETAHVAGGDAHQCPLRGIRPSVRAHLAQ